MTAGTFAMIGAGENNTLLSPINVSPPPELSWNTYLVHTRPCPRICNSVDTLSERASALGLDEGEKMMGHISNAIDVLGIMWKIKWVSTKNKSRVRGADP
jgi:hypothetical protein